MGELPQEKHFADEDETIICFFSMDFHAVNQIMLFFSCGSRNKSYDLLREHLNVSSCLYAYICVCQNLTTYFLVRLIGK